MSPLDSLAPPLTLRPLSPGDAPALQEVYQVSTDFFAGSGGASPVTGQAEADLAAAAAEDGRFLLGITLHESMIGVIDLRLAYPDPFDMSIGLILLATQHRRQGLGTWTLRILEAWLARDTPTEAVIVAVPAQDHAAQTFFHANGYTFTGQSTRVIAGSSRPRLLQMRKSLVD
ncbi:MAG: GNAT family N-acetyltransferase [Anaerolineae bacterium]